MSQDTHFVGLAEFSQDSADLYSLIRGKGYQFIYGVPRGGVPLAMRLISFGGFSLIEDESELARVAGDKVLVVDDLIDSGATRKRFEEFDFAVLYWKDRMDIDALDRVYHVKRSPPDVWLRFWYEGKQETVQDNVRRIFEYIGEDPNREGLKETPDRVIRSYDELFSGYGVEPESVFKVFEEKYDELVLLRDIEMYSMCEHHMLPFSGRAHIAYIAEGRVIGVSKLARLLEVFSRRLQVQERIGVQVVEALMKHLNPKGAACIIEARHLCMSCRGVGKQNSVMVTSALRGCFRQEVDARNELMTLIAGNQ